uniref:Uncharacterized protein n=1 Tax=Arundo donax TaxID=35708 RepID=A0A0A9DC83_ARUDO
MVPLSNKHFSLYSPRSYQFISEQFWLALAGLLTNLHPRLLSATESSMLSPWTSCHYQVFYYHV